MTFLEAINTGHGGSMTTLHAETPQLAVQRLAIAALKTEIPMTYADMIQYIENSIDVIIQAGAFGEHQFTRVRQVVHYPYQFQTIGRKILQVRLGPGAGGRLEIGLKRFVNPPTYAFPWHGDEIPVR